jgi:hypothetical protein
VDKGRERFDVGVEPPRHVVDGQIQGVPHRARFVPRRRSNPSTSS